MDFYFLAFYSWAKSEALRVKIDKSHMRLISGKINIKPQVTAFVTGQNLVQNS